MRHKMMTHSAYPVCDGKKGMLSQHFVTHVVPPLLFTILIFMHSRGGGGGGGWQRGTSSQVRSDCILCPVTVMLL